MDALLAIRSSGDPQLVAIDVARLAHGERAHRVAGRGELDVVAGQLLRPGGPAEVEGEIAVALLLEFATHEVRPVEAAIPPDHASRVKSNREDRVAADLERCDGESRPAGTGSCDCHTLQQLRQHPGGEARGIGFGRAAGAGHLNHVAVRGTAKQPKSGDGGTPVGESGVGRRIDRLPLDQVQHAGRVGVVGSHGDERGEYAVGIGRCDGGDHARRERRGRPGGLRYVLTPAGRCEDDRAEPCSRLCAERSHHPALLNTSLAATRS